MKICVTFLTAVIFLSYQNVFSQTNTFPASGSAGIGTLTPNASALLDMVSSTNGILIPRMSKTQRDAISAPATGLLIYQKNSGPGFYYFNGSAWIALAGASYSAGSGISITGTTITNTGDVNAADDLLSTTVFNGDISGTFSTMQIIPGAILGTDINSMGAATGQALKWNGLTWSPAADLGTTYTGGTGISVSGTIITNTAPDQLISLSGAGGATVTGTYPNFTVSTIATGLISGTAAGNTIYWNGSSWVTNSSNIYNNGGNVGIGTTTPSANSMYPVMLNFMG